MPDSEAQTRTDPPVDSAPIDTATQLRRALAAVSGMRQRLEAVEGRAREPIAIVGMACRFPGAPDLESYWRLLDEGRDAISEVPRERWDVDALYDPDPDAPGKMNSRWGGFVDGVDRFDAGFFGISPREAVGIDPQQRLLLESAWHALEDAAIPPDELAGSQTGVYVGLSTTDYAQVLADREDGVDWIDAHASLGNSAAVAAGRLSYTLGLQGPAMTVDTACSSSLVSVHLAVQALRSGEIGLGLAAGVNLILSPELTIGFSKARMMAADGRCKTLDAAADGYVRGEGCGVVVLKRLSDALADGDRIHALVLGSAVNQDGRSNGLTAPNGPAQAAVIRAALGNAGTAPDTVSYVEMHGTGTPLGDPIEARALATVFGDDGDRFVGSVKTNIGHLESAAGMAGLIKAALAAERGRIPAHLNFRALNEHIAADGFPFRVPTATVAWEGHRVAGVSSFGFSGTNGHVIVAEPPPVEARPAAVRPVQVLALSARDPEALEASRAAVDAALADPAVDLPGLAATLSAGRGHHPHRLAVAAADPVEARQALAAAVPERAAEAPAVAFLFTGQGCQYPGMARGLLAEPAFRDVIERCDEALGDRLGRPLSAWLRDGGAALDSTAIVQPLLFAVEVATAALWRSWGVEPTAVLGHSVGEVAAACVAGAVSVEDGIAFIAERGRLMQERAGFGGMAAVLAPEAEVKRAIDGTGAVIAALNGPASTVIAGDTAAMARAVERLQRAGLTAQRLEVATAFHSPVLDPCLDGIERAADAVAWTPMRLPLASNLTGGFVTRFEAGYWRRQARGAVRFADGLRAVLDRGCRVLVEVGPHPVLSTLGRSVDGQATYLPSLRRGADDCRMVAEALARLYALGAPVEWQAYHGDGWCRAPAPLYPFRRDRHWPEPRSSGPSVPRRSMEHPLLGARIASPVAATLYEARLDAGTMPFLADHVVFGEVVAPGAMHAVLGLAMAEARGQAAPAVADLVFAEPLTVPDDGVSMQCVLEPDGAYTVNGLGGDGEWTLHASGRLETEAGTAPDPLDLDAMRARLAADGGGPDALFAMLGDRGIDLGPSFRGLHAIWRGDGEALAEILRPSALAESAGRMPIHPALLDSCFQLLGATFTGEGTAGGFLPLSVDRVRVWRRPGERFFCHARIADSGPSREVAVGNFVLADADGAVLAAVDGLQIKRVAAPTPRDPVTDSLLAVEWVPANLPDPDWADPAALAAPAAAEAAARIAALPAIGLADDLERLAAAYARDALTALGATVDGDPAAVGVQPRHARLFRRLFALAAAADGEDSFTLASRLRATYPDNQLEVDLVERCGAGLTGVLRGEADPLQLLFADGSSSIYGGGGLAETANAIAARALETAAARRGPQHRPRVLEVGAGTGATTAALLPGLDGCEYRFTDVSPGFLAAAEKRFGDRAGIRFELLDLEREPAGQGFPPGTADVVVAANVVHATADLRQSLRHLRQALAPGGLLLLVESTAPQRWWDIVFGLTEGWWRFTDTDLRPDHALLPAERWRPLLAGEGFAAVETVGADAEGRQTMILARALDPTPVLAAHDGRDGPARDLAEGLAAALVARGQAARALAAAEALAALADAPATVVHTGGVGAADQQPLRDAFDLARAMAGAGREGLLLVTRGAQTGDAALDAVEGASLTGFGRVAALELPELGCRRVDLDPGDDDPVACLLRELSAADGEAEVAWRGGVRLAARLAPHPLPPAEPAFDDGGTYLVTGGFGGLGPLLAGWLVRHGAGAVVLAGRREPDPALAERLAALGPAVQPRVADVADEAAMTALLAEIDADGRPLKGVFHLAGSVADGAIVAQSWEAFAGVLPAKVDGARILDRLTRGRDLEHFVLFSTSASLIGNLGQANHAAANAFLDALARARRAAGLPGLSVNWGAWGEAGAVVEGAYSEAMAGSGVRPIRPEDGLDGLARAMAGDRGQVGFVDLDWPAFLAGHGDAVPAYLQRFRPTAVRRAPRPARGSAATAATSATDIPARLAAVAPEARGALLAELLLAEAAAVLGVADPGRIDPSQALNELGLDSMLALELRNRLSAALGATQPATLLFNYPSVAALAEHFAAELLDISPVPTAAAPRPPEPSYDAEITAMSDAELEALFDAELANLGGG
ncbi:type I polyketide synthase [Thalassobaculum sp.]|uniref:type I polyketide synthase n=1 Tax=Thalassobaculum sp. TaxID=2022740 RepID=UPI0032EBD9C5